MNRRLFDRLKLLSKKKVIMLILPLLIPAAAYYFKDLAVTEVENRVNPGLNSMVRSADSAISPKKMNFFTSIVSKDLSGDSDVFSLRGTASEPFILSLENREFIRENMPVEETVERVPEKAEATDNETAEIPPAPGYKLSSVFIGMDKKFAIIDGGIYRQGEDISDNETIIELDEGRILLDGLWGQRWIYVDF
ncbi:hypothetical protein [Limisalsivibrio acetivorans]|uniref:hypothetical protein n=1 Tax=Limisalsivibrio acetivorans TaxID=1304888 RepID=UPI0003B33030|nr:hypothetical protein [Limisalsivibrio acetivorans]